MKLVDRKNKKSTMETFRDHADTVRYFTGLTDFMTQASSSHFYLPFDKKLALSLFQALVLTFLLFRVNLPLRKILQSRFAASMVLHETTTVLNYTLKSVEF